MRNGDKKHGLKTLLVDTFMGLNFVLLAAFAVWLVWIYYFRGPTEIVTGRSEGEAGQDLLAQARREHSTHFHNLDELVVEGIQSGSLCVKCHGDYPHAKSKKVRALFNAHSWFIACEVCHLKPEDGAEVVYRWLDNKTGGELGELTGDAGNYGAMIVPIQLEMWGRKRLDEPENEDFIKEYLRSGAGHDLSEQQRKEAEDTIHEKMLKDPVFCDQCHKYGGLIDFEKLLYPPQRVLHLESIDMGAMAKTYEEFYFPDVLGRQTR